MNPTVILLAAGKSSRMWPLSDKIFFEYLGKTVLEHQFNHLAESGLNDFIIVGNKNNIQKIKDTLRKKKQNIKYAIQKDLNKGVMGGVMAASSYVDEKNPILLISSNDFVEKNIFKKVLYKANKSSSEILIVGKIVEKYFPGGYLKLNSKKNIIKIVEKPKPGKEPSNLVNLVIQLYKDPKKLFDKYKNLSNKNDDAHELALQKLFDDKIIAEVVDYKGFWQALKYPWHHLLLMNHFLNNLKTKFIHKNTKISKNAVINGPVYISSGVKIFDFAVINGPVYIGRNSIIGNGVLIRNSIIGNNCVIGHTTEVCRSYLSDSNWTHQNYIGDSVFEKNISLGAGTRTGNLRLDEGEISSFIKEQRVNSGLNKLGSIMGSNVRIGINTSIMPGIKIGQQSFVGAGIVVDKDIKDSEFIKGFFSINKNKNLKNINKRKNNV